MLNDGRSGRCGTSNICVFVIVLKGLVLILGALTCGELKVITALRHIITTGRRVISVQTPLEWLLLLKRWRPPVLLRSQLFAGFVIISVSIKAVVCQQVSFFLNSSEITVEVHALPTSISPSWKTHSDANCTLTAGAERELTAYKNQAVKQIADFMERLQCAQRGEWVRDKRRRLIMFFFLGIILCHNEMVEWPL